MQAPTLSRRAALAGTLGLVAVGAAACGSDGTTASSSASTSATTNAETSSSSEIPTLETLVAEVTDEFTRETYTDAPTGLSLPYNLFVPADHDASQSHPLVLYIADSSLVGQDVTAPLSQYGALIWASESEQAKHAGIVVVPQYPEVVIDDHGSYTTTDYVALTPRLLEEIKSRYSVDENRVYGTGQSMGCMTVMHLAAQDPELFAAELFVSGQWDISELGPLAGEKFFYIAAGGDEKAFAGQEEVKAMLTDAGVSSQAATWDATWSAQELSDAAAELFAAGDDINFATFETGTVVSANGSAGSGGTGSSEHMASFQPAYEIGPLRDWLFQQSAT
ncbi:alpha/beta hydrolase-fold protein [Paenibacillus sp. TRM 82003]|uniref:carboxylesterase family protein n=1 Tax=Kineococcus sp. TRM81007 TaxID=2925831 RepID=UPI001F577A76|nr:alpha/beta hydrolase-fold protein [Kineococcus sp. TRM81007]MCI2239437.1 alpha/beta hydrolase-fold protein [Kineococcus sp. TRM81007]MCI3918807.1 alpha/beta hydrolase-fold protein [Paenibacillus sp. TRM 82003]